MLIWGWQIWRTKQNAQGRHILSKHLKNPVMFWASFWCWRERRYNSSSLTARGIEPCEFIYMVPRNNLASRTLEIWGFMNYSSWLRYNNTSQDSFNWAFATNTRGERHSLEIPAPYRWQEEGAFVSLAFPYMWLFLMDRIPDGTFGMQQHSSCYYTLRRSNASKSVLN